MNQKANGPTNNRDRIVTNRLVGTPKHKQKLMTSKTTEVPHRCEIIIGQPGGYMHARCSLQANYHELANACSIVS